MNHSLIQLSQNFLHKERLTVDIFALYAEHFKGFHVRELK